MNPGTLARSAFTVLLAWQPVWHVLLHGSGGSSTRAIIMMVPLLLLAIPVWRKRPNALIWAGVAILFYFCYAVMEWWIYPGAWSGPAIQVFACIVFVFAIRARARRNKARAARGN